MKKLSNLMMHNPLLIGDLQTSDTNVEIHSATCYNDDSGSGAAESSKQTRQ